MGHDKFMHEALREARLALQAGEVPVGSILVSGEGRILARGHNRTIREKDPTAHAEVLVLRRAAGAVGNYRLTGTTLYVTVEPCLMCAGAMIWARIERLVYGAHDPKAGAAETLYRVLGDRRLNHQVELVSGVMEGQCREILQRFFKEARADCLGIKTTGQKNF